jgi:hypothetical protein
MKNILVYINRNFSPWADKATEIQIDNSLELGWKKEDILLISNFPYEYHGIKSIEVDNSIFFQPSPTVSKINAAIELFKRNIVKNELYWLHDLDAFQVNPFGEIPLDGCDIGVCNYGRMPMWAAGTIFFNEKSLDILQALKDYSYQHNCTEQKALRSVVGHSTDLNLRTEMGKRVKLMNITYNFNSCNMRSNWQQSEKPLKVIHFHLTPEMKEIFLGSRNPIGKEFVTDRFRKYFV